MNTNITRLSDPNSIFRGQTAGPLGVFAFPRNRFRLSSAALLLLLPAALLLLLTGCDNPTDPTVDEVDPTGPVGTVQPETLDFGEIEVGQAMERHFTIESVGDEPLCGTVETSCGDYVVVSGAGDYCLPTGQTLTVTIRFGPTATGLSECAVGVGSVGPSYVTCSGAGRALPWQWNSAGGADGAIESLALYQGAPVAGGYFENIAGSTVMHVARWNGSLWQPLAGGLGGSGADQCVLTLTETNAGDLIAGGRFIGNKRGGVARWNGASWQFLGAGMNNKVFAVIEYKDEIYAGGTFSYADGEYVKKIARWTGSNWSELDGGVEGHNGHCRVAALIEHDGKLVVGGSFTRNGGLVSGGVVMWNGTGWEHFTSNLDQAVNALAVLADQIYAACGNERVYRWTGEAWQQIGGHFSGGQIQALVEWNGTLMATGGFTGNEDSTTAYDRVALLVDGVWLPFHSGVTAPVHAILPTDSGLFVGTDSGHSSWFLVGE